MDQFNQSNRLGDDHNKIAIFEHCLAMTPFATENELRTRNINTRLKLPFHLKTTLEFLRCSLFTAENRFLLSNFCAADFLTKDTWVQHDGGKTDIGNPCKLQDLDFVAKMMFAVVATASSLSDYISHIIDLRTSKIQMRLQKLKAILRTVQFYNILQDVMKVGSNPVICVENVERIVGKSSYKKHFLGSDKTFLAGALTLYVEHVLKLKIIMQHIKNKYGKNFFKQNENSKLKKGIFKIDPKDLVLDNITTSFDTTQMNGTYSLPTDTVIPGSFYQFCEAIAMPTEEAAARYETFLMYEIKDLDDDEGNEFDDDDDNFSSDESENDPFEGVSDTVSDRVRQFFATNKTMSMSTYMRIVFSSIRSQSLPSHEGLSKCLSQLQRDYVRYIQQHYEEEKEFQIPFLETPKDSDSEDSY